MFGDKKSLSETEIMMQKKLLKVFLIKKDYMKKILYMMDGKNI